MENQVTSSAGSSSPQPEKSKDMIQGESKEKAPENNNSNLSIGSSSQEAMSEMRTENPSPRVVPIPRTGSEMVLLYPSRSNKIYTCQFCSKGFSTSQALGGHQNAHKQDRDWEKKRKEMEENFPGLAFLSPYDDKPHLLLGGYSQDSLSNDNHLGITLEPFRRRGTGLYPPFSGGVGDMDMRVVPRMNPTRFFNGNTFTDGGSSSGFGPRPSFNNFGPMVPSNVPPYFLPPPPPPPPFFPPPPRTMNLPSCFYYQDDGPNVENLISKIGKDEVVEIIDDDDDQPGEGTSKSWGDELTLSL